MRYDVVLVGFRLNATLKPAQALETVLGLDPQTAKTLAKRFPARVLAGVGYERAEEAVEALIAVGAKAEARPSQREGSAASGGHPASPAPPAPRKEPAPPAPRQEQDLPSAAKSPASAAAQMSSVEHTASTAPASGHYQLGDILAPGAQASPSVEIELESPLDALSQHAGQLALRPSAVDLFGPEPANSNVPRSPAKPPQGAPSPAQPARPQTNAVPPALAAAPEGPDTSAFGGMRNFGDGLEDMGDGPALDLDPAALRSIQRTSNEAVAKRPRSAPKPRTPLDWLRAKLANLARFLGGWLLAVLTLALVCAVTLALVAYALNPEDMLGAVSLDRARGLLAPLLPAR